MSLCDRMTDSSTIDFASNTSPDFAAVLTQAADAFRGERRDAAAPSSSSGFQPKRDRPTAEQVVNALLQAEKTAKQQRLSYPFASLNGRWRLCFATGTRKVRQRGSIILGKGFYLPKFAPAYISFTSAADADSSPDRGDISNQIQVGSVTVKFTGPLKYMGKKNLLAFDFSQIHVSVLGLTLYSGAVGKAKADHYDFYQQAIATLPFFAFFWVTDDCIAARGRGGGLALWIRDN